MKKRGDMHAPGQEELEGKVRELGLQVEQYRKMLWVLARKEGLSLMIPKAELDSVPAEAELLVWYEEHFDSMMLKGICSSINQPDLAKPVTEKSGDEPARNWRCAKCGKISQFKDGMCWDCFGGDPGQ